LRWKRVKDWCHKRSPGAITFFAQNEESGFTRWNFCDEGEREEGVVCIITDAPAFPSLKAVEKRKASEDAWKKGGVLAVAEKGSGIVCFPILSRSSDPLGEP